MSDFRSMGLLDIESKSTNLTPLLDNFSKKSCLLQLNEHSNSLHNQNQHLETTETSKNLMRNASSQIKTCNLEDLLSSTSLMYVSGDCQGLDSTKLPLEFCTEPCCNSRVKYATVHRVNDSKNNNGFHASVPLPGLSHGKSNWDLGSDGASTPGSTSLGDVLGCSGLVRPSSRWHGPHVPDLGFGSSNAVFFETSLTYGGHAESYLDPWGTTNAFYETDNTFEDFMENGTESIGQSFNKTPGNQSYKIL